MRALALALLAGMAAAGGGTSKAAKRLAQAHAHYEAAQFPEAAAGFSKVLRLSPSPKLQASLGKAGLGPLQLTPYRREFARALVVGGDYAAAAEQLSQMRAAASHLPRAELAGRFESDVLREEAQVFQCRGELKDAASALRRSVKLLKATSGPSAPRPADFFERYQRLATLETWLGRASKASEAAAKAIDAKDSAGAAGVMRRNRGEHARPMASWLPDVSGTDDSPWRSLTEPGYAELAATLVAETAALRDEAVALWEAGRFNTQPECMHQRAPGAEGLGQVAAGAEWTQLPVVGVDFMRAERGGCSEHTPLGCALVSRLVKRWRANSAAGAAAVEVERVGYSTLAAGGWIRPHWGETNARLKLHLGLVVGSGPEGCAALTVGGEARAWGEGEVLFFDDSYEHEAWNNCSVGEGGLPRIVLQVVVRHPRAPAD